MNEPEKVAGIIPRVLDALRKESVMGKKIETVSSRNVDPSEVSPRFFIVGAGGDRRPCYPDVFKHVHDDGSEEYMINEHSVLPTMGFAEAFCGSYAIAYPQPWGAIWVHSINEDCAPENKLAVDHGCRMSFGGAPGGDVLVEVSPGQNPPWAS